ncbi:MAG: 6-phosphogluconolactonase, partial [Bryobacteraceae bacterium]
MSAATHVYPSAKAAAEACGARAARLLEDAIRKSGRATFALSGGSTPIHMFDTLAAMPLDWARIHWFWVDERMVPPENEESTVRLVKQHLFDRVSPPPANIHRIFGELPSEQALAGYESDLRNFFALGPADLPRFDIIHRGMGPETHTASLFPGSPLIADRTGLAAVVTTP